MSTTLIASNVGTPSLSAPSITSSNPSSKAAPLTISASALYMTSTSCADAWKSCGSVPTGMIVTTSAASPTTCSTTSPSMFVVTTMFGNAASAAGASVSLGAFDVESSTTPASSDPQAANPRLSTAAAAIADRAYVVRIPDISLQLRTNLILSKTIAGPRINPTHVASVGAFGPCRSLSECIGSGLTPVFGCW